MHLTVFQKGFNFSEDGPGNRLVLHLQGCNMRCPWCANPEGMAIKPPLMQLSQRLPDWLCPNGAIQGGALDRGVCEQCSARECVHETRNQYLKVQAESKTVEDWLLEIQSASPMFFSGGGVTLTGGEVGVQLDAAIELLRLCRAAGVHTAIESNLTREDMSRIYPYLSLLIADYKHYDSQMQQAATGVGNFETERNLISALKMGLKVLVRIPLINGFNADAQDIVGFATSLSQIASHGDADQFSIELLRYHEYGKDKWAQCGLDYCVKDGYVKLGRLRKFVQALSEAGLRVVST